MAVELAEMIQIVLGSALISSVISSVISTGVTYFLEQRATRKQRTYGHIKEVYLKALYDVEAALSIYSMALVTTGDELRARIRRLRDSNTDTPENFRTEIETLAGWERVDELLQANYVVALPSFPRLMEFGMTVYSAVKRTLYAYTRIMRSLMEPSVMWSQYQESREAFLTPMRGLHALINIAQQTEVYLERRFRQLDDYIWKKEYQTFGDFQKLEHDPQVKILHTELQSYVQRLDAWSDHMTKETSLALNEWLSGKIDLNPFSPDYPMS